MTAKKSTKTGKNFRVGGGKNFSGWPEYIPLPNILSALSFQKNEKMKIRGFSSLTSLKYNFPVASVR